MLSELALVDWVALLIAIVLLGAAAIASYLSHSNSGPAVVGAPGTSDPLESPEQQSPARYSPSHAASAAVDAPANAVEPQPGLANAVTPVPPAPAHAEPTSGHVHAAVPKVAPVLANAPAPPILKRSSDPDDVLDLTDSALEENAAGPTDKVATGESIARRAARLRKRPVSEPEAQGHARVQVREMKVSNENESELVFANATNKLSVGMESADGFEKRSPGFFSDPIGRHELRYWNGSSWTEYVKEGADRFIDPL